jgi:hypothetical protein
MYFSSRYAQLCRSILKKKAMKQAKQIFTVISLTMSLVFTACDKNSHHQQDNISNQVILTWNAITFETMGGPANQHTLLASRVYAMVHVAMHDAINATDAHFQPYTYNKKIKTANPEVAAATAAHRVLKTAFAERGNFLDSALNSFLATFSESENKTNGMLAGIEAANALLALGHNDFGLQDPIAQPQPAVKPGDYKVYAPFGFIFAPFWENAKLWSLQSKDQFRPVPPPALNSNEYATAFNEVKTVGFINSATRTADQTAYAKYWYELSPEGWNRIAKNVASQRHSGLFTTARLFALLNMALADAYTAGWDAKQYYNFWRPITAIQEADTDGNANTAGDINWVPSETTPPIQDYPSTHSALGNAGAAVLAYIYGDNIAFSMQSPSAVPANSARSFSSFSQAANENADSRVMAGIHFRFSCKAGQELGAKIGKWTADHYLKPVK